MLHPLIAEHLSPDDDADLWDVATTMLLAEAAAASTRQEIYAQIGRCHHWISPHHPIRWSADGGFAWPFGYDKTTTDWSYRALPEFPLLVYAGFVPPHHPLVRRAVRGAHLAADLR